MSKDRTQEEFNFWAFIEKVSSSDFIYVKKLEKSGFLTIPKEENEYSSFCRQKREKLWKEIEQLGLNVS